MTSDEKLKMMMAILLEDTEPPAPNPGLTTSSPPAPTSQTPSSDIVSMMEMMKQMNETYLHETRALVIDILQGRQQPVTGLTEMLRTNSDESLTYDYDSTPLAPGIEAILAREQMETSDSLEQRRSMEERRTLQARLIELQEEERLFRLEESLNEQQLPSSLTSTEDDQ